MHSRIFDASESAWEQSMSEKLLAFSRDQLCIALPFLCQAFSAFEYHFDERLTTLAVDGKRMYYSVRQLFQLFPNNPSYINRIYLHSVLHLIFSHLWLRGKRDAYLWGIACDIAVEYTIDHLEAEELNRILDLRRLQVYQSLEKDGSGISAANIYCYLKGKSQEECAKLYQEFFADDHVFWPKEEKLRAEQLSLQQVWGKLARQQELRRKKKRGKETKEGEELLSYQIRVARGRSSYRDFLKKFTVFREEMHLDPEEFDLGYYSYGMALYKNIPLIEPLESREIHKIRDFVIAVDTSYSTNGELVEGFLRETLRILKQQDNFFRHGRIHLIQADEKVQSDILLQDEDQIRQLFSNFQIRGGGGTDFRPVFDYVDRLLEEGRFEQLCGLLYFTDGKGIYPARKPAYRTAFLFLKEYPEEKLPVWAMRLRLEPEEFVGGDIVD